MEYYYLTPTKKNALMTRLNLVVNGRKHSDVLLDRGIEIVPIQLENGNYILPKDLYDDHIIKAIFDALNFSTLTLKTRDQLVLKTIALR